MGIDIKGASGRPIASPDSKKARAAGNAKTSSGSSTASGSTGGSDRVSITDSASQLQALSAQIASLPAEDAKHVADVQRAIASGNFEFEPEEAAEHLLTQEREFAEQAIKEKKT